MGGSPLARAGDGTVGRHETRVPVAGSAGAGLLEVGFTPRNSGGIPRAGRAQDSSVVHASSPSREVEKGGLSVVPWRSVPPVSHEIPGGPPAFGFLVVGLAPEYPRVISPSPVMQVFAARTRRYRARAKESTATASAGNSRRCSLEGPVRVPPRPAAPQATRSRPSIGRLADPPEGWTTSMTLPLATQRMGRKMPSPAGCRCGSEGSAQH